MESYSDLKTKLGEGSFGDVWKFRRRVDQQLVALKFSKKNKRQRRAFKREVTILELIQHEKIVKYIESFEYQSKMVIVTELLSQTLLEHLKVQKRIPEPMVRVFACELVSAFHFIHNKRILHLDVKPENIMLNDYGGAKLCDFGLSQRMSPTTHVLIGCKGEFGYRSPEQLGDRPMDHTTDLWSLGVTLLQLLRGSLPFEPPSFDPFLWAHNIGTKDPDWPPIISDNCKDFLGGLLVKDRLHRLSWPELKHHPFVLNYIPMWFSKTEADSLTVTPSPQVLKEKQKQTAALTPELTDDNASPLEVAESWFWMEDLQKKREAQQAQQAQQPPEPPGAS